MKQSNIYIKQLRISREGNEKIISKFKKQQEFILKKCIEEKNVEILKPFLSNFKIKNKT